MSYVLITFTGIGASVFLYIAFLLIYEVARSLYWSIWTLYPVARANPSEANVRNCAEYIWKCFMSEVGSVYDNREIAGVYSHGYHPWNERHRFI